MDLHARISTILVALCLSLLLALLPLRAQDAAFHNAPLETKNLKDPYDSRPPAHAGELYHRYCGSKMRIYAYGIRNAVGLAVQPETGQLWCSVNERDPLGDNLVPDYITHVQEGRFYGWPWCYMGGHQDPRHEGKHPELKDRVITPDVSPSSSQGLFANDFLHWQSVPGRTPGRHLRR